MTHPLLRLCYLKRQKVRLSQVCIQLEHIANVHQTQHTIQLLLGTSDFVGALELITRTQSILSSDLRGVTCLRYYYYNLCVLSPFLFVFLFVFLSFSLSLPIYLCLSLCLCLSLSLPLSLFHHYTVCTLHYTMCTCININTLLHVQLL